MANIFLGRFQTAETEPWVRDLLHETPTYIGVTATFIVIAGLEVWLHTVLLCFYLIRVAIRSEKLSEKLLASFMIPLILFLKLLYWVPTLLLIYPETRLRLLQEWGISDDAYFGLTMTLVLINAILVLAPVICGCYFSHKNHWHRSLAADEQIGEREVPISEPFSKLPDLSKARESRIDETEDVPLVVVLMPIYNELPDTLIRAVNSVLDSDYRKERLHVLLAFDDDTLSTSYLQTCTRLGIYTTPGLQSTYPEVIHSDRLGVKLTVCRFPHAGKRATQRAAFRVLEQFYGRYQSAFHDGLLCFTDSDMVLEKSAISSFVKAMENDNYAALTGLIFAAPATVKGGGPVSSLQDVEYFHGQMYGRHFESLIGGVTCLPGALTLLRMRAFFDVAPEYFGPMGHGMMDFHRCHLGEDRFLTHLLMVHQKRSYALGFCHEARCQTEVPASWRDLIQQRRRWYLGTVSNDAYLLASPTVWRTLPVLSWVQLMNNVRSIGLLLYFVYILLPLQFRPVAAAILYLFWPLIVIWIVILLDAIRLKRYSMIFSYPIIYFLQPFFHWIVAVYAFVTLHRLTWGGPRVDANVSLNADTATLFASSEYSAMLEEAATRANYQTYRTSNVQRHSTGRPSTVQERSSFSTDDAVKHPTRRRSSRRQTEEAASLSVITKSTNDPSLLPSPTRRSARLASLRSSPVTPQSKKSDVNDHFSYHYNEETGEMEQIPRRFSQGTNTTSHDSISAPVQPALFRDTVLTSRTSSSYSSTVDNKVDQLMQNAPVGRVRRLSARASTAQSNNSRIPVAMERVKSVRKQKHIPSNHSLPLVLSPSENAPPVPPVPSLHRQATLRAPQTVHMPSQDQISTSDLLFNVYSHYTQPPNHKD